MVIIKKYSTTKGRTSGRKERLDAYGRQSRSFRKTKQKKNGISEFWKKGALAAIIPLAAATTLNGQCLGPATINLGASGRAQLDVDGDGNDDFSFYHLATGVYIPSQSLTSYYGMLAMSEAGHNHTNFVHQFGSLVIKLAVNKVVRRASVDGGTAAFGYGAATLCSERYDKGNFCKNDGTGYVAIRKGDAATGKPGWIHMYTNVLNENGAQIIIYERGFEGDGDNSAITGQCSTLPVEMLYFRTKVHNKSIQLHWATASELNNAGFEVQRSKDGRSFAKIGWVDGRGTTLYKQEYVFTDTEVQPNTSYYYRLRQMDNDGTEEYSPIRQAIVKDANSFEVSELFPNPTSKDYGFSMFKLHVPEEGEVAMQVFDVQGKLVKELTKNFPAGSSTLSVPVAELAQGQYFVKLQLGKDVQYRKMVVK